MHDHPGNEHQVARHNGSKRYAAESKRDAVELARSSSERTVVQIAAGVEAEQDGRSPRDSSDACGAQADEREGVERLFE